MLCAGYGGVSDSTDADRMSPSHGHPSPRVVGKRAHTRSHHVTLHLFRLRIHSFALTDCSLGLSVVESTYLRFGTALESFPPSRDTGGPARILLLQFLCLLPAAAASCLWCVRGFGGMWVHESLVDRQQEPINKSTRISRGKQEAEGRIPRHCRHRCIGRLFGDRDRSIDQSWRGGRRPPAPPPKLNCTCSRQSRQALCVCVSMDLESSIDHSHSTHTCSSLSRALVVRLLRPSSFFFSLFRRRGQQRVGAFCAGAFVCVCVCVWLLLLLLRCVVARCWIVATGGKPLSAALLSSLLGGFGFVVSNTHTRRRRQQHQIIRARQADGAVFVTHFLFAWTTSSATHTFSRRRRNPAQSARGRHHHHQHQEPLATRPMARWLVCLPSTSTTPSCMLLASLKLVPSTININTPPHTAHALAAAAAAAAVFLHA
jgi:hypothetical protein